MRKVKQNVDIVRSHLHETKRYQNCIMADLIFPKIYLNGQFSSKSGGMSVKFDFDIPELGFTNWHCSQQHK